MRIKPRPEGNDLTETVTPPTAAEIRERAIGLLARREHSRLELEQKLRQRDFPADGVAPVLDELEQENLLNESRYAAAVVASQVNRGNGPLKIRAALQTAGVVEALIDDALDDADVDWNALAARVRARRFGAARPSAFNELARQARFLASRGFSRGQASAACQHDLEET